MTFSEYTNLSSYYSTLRVLIERWKVPQGTSSFGLITFEKYCTPGTLPPVVPSPPVVPTAHLTTTMGPCPREFVRGLKTSWSKITCVLGDAKLAGVAGQAEQLLPTVPRSAEVY